MKQKHFDRDKDRSNWFRTVSQQPEQIEQLKQNCKSFPRWFWIEHDPDHEHSTKHLHLLILCSGSYRIKTVARKLDVPENMVQPAFNHEQDAKYFIHLNEGPEKKKYSPEEVHTNCPGMYKSMIQEQLNDDVHILFYDLTNLRRGKMKLDEFIERHYKEIQTMPFYQKIKMYECIEKLTNNRVSHETAT